MKSLPKAKNGYGDVNGQGNISVLKKGVKM